MSGTWCGNDSFVYISSNQKLCCLVAGQTEVIAHTDRLVQSLEISTQCSDCQAPVCVGVYAGAWEGVLYGQGLQRHFVRVGGVIPLLR